MGSAADQRGSAAVESVFAVALISLMTLAAVQVALVLYGRNAVMAAAHEGVRAAVERGTRAPEAAAAAAAAVRAAAGGLVDELDVEVESVAHGDGELVGVRVRGLLDVAGPLPLRLPVDFTARAVKPGPVR